LEGDLGALVKEKRTATTAVAPGGPAERHSPLISFFMGASPQTPGLAALERELKRRTAATAVASGGLAERHSPLSFFY
jgi:phosphoserine phosphatase